jgi:hypothetical protein
VRRLKKEGLVQLEAVEKIRVEKEECQHVPARFE